MNKTLQDFARAEIKKGLSQCNNKQQMVFKRLYSHRKLSLPIDEIVDKLNADKLDWVMKQVENTLIEKQKRRLEKAE